MFYKNGKHFFRLFSYIIIIEIVQDNYSSS